VTVTELPRGNSDGSSMEWRAGRRWRDLRVAAGCAVSLAALIAVPVFGAPDIRPGGPSVAGHDQLDSERAAHRAMAQTPPDWVAARAAFKRAAESGSTTAMSYLGWMHEQGHGVAVDGERAAFWYARAAGAGAPRFALKLGWMYLGGQGVAQSRERAEVWFRRALNADYAPARLALASVLIGDALGVEPDQAGGVDAGVIEARELLEQALADGDVRASYFLARIYLEGIGGHPVSPTRAFEFASLGADAGMPGLQGWLALFYRDGVGTDVDPVAAAVWARLASAGGDPLGEALWLELQARLSADQRSDVETQVRRWAEGG